MTMEQETAVRKLLSPERERLILDSLTGGIRTIAELSARLGVSEATVRRDLQSLESQGRVRRVHGGAEPVGGLNGVEPLFSEKTGIHAEEKNQIAELALQYIDDNDAIYLDGGSTILALARRLNLRKNLTVVTNSLMAASELMESGHRLILLGGEFRARSRTLVGPLTERILNTLTIQKAFLGTMGFSVEDGISTSDPNEAYTKELVMRHARKVILLVDSSKIGVPSFAASGVLGDLDAVVTDNGIPEKTAALLRKKHIEVVTPGASAPGT